VGISGEMYIGGEGLARGYQGRADLTAERFVPHPFSVEPGERLYRTGDRGRYRANGEIEFEGRLDRQVKVRGYRVELGEIESVLREQEGVEDAVAVLKEDRSGEKRVVAYVTPRPGRSTWRRRGM
jgi:non-ribosomal peptide synthetase component F